MTKSFDIVITGNSDAILEYLKKEGYTWGSTVTYLTDPKIIEGKHIAGILSNFPVKLAARCASVTDIQLNIGVFSYKVHRI